MRPQHPGPGCALKSEIHAQGASRLVRGDWPIRVVSPIRSPPFQRKQILLPPVFAIFIVIAIAIAIASLLLPAAATATVQQTCFCLAPGKGGDNGRITVGRSGNSVWRWMLERAWRVGLLNGSAGEQRVLAQELHTQAGKRWKQALEQQPDTGKPAPAPAPAPGRLTRLAIHSHNQSISLHSQSQGHLVQ
ncbi:hypothetical protein LPJ72_006236, partial [Coemansia sp. Benny D160-2]